MLRQEKQAEGREFEFTPHDFSRVRKANSPKSGHFFV